MHSVQAQPAMRLPLANGRPTIFGRLAALLAANLRRPRPANGVVPNYEGRAWSDSTEQQVITGILTCRRTAI